MAWSYRSQTASDVYDSTAVVAPSGGSGTTSKVAGSDFTTTTSGSNVSITGLTFAASASTLYEVDVLLRMQNSNTIAHQWGIFYSAVGATGNFYYLFGGNSTTSSTAIQILGSMAAPNTCQEASVNMMVWIKGIAVIGANAGNITVQLLRSGAGTTTIYVGSRMTVTAL